MVRLTIKLLGVLGGVLLFVAGGFLLWAAVALMRHLPYVGDGTVNPSYYILGVGPLSITGEWIYVFLGVLILLGVGTLFLAAFIIRSLFRNPPPN